MADTINTKSFKPEGQVSSTKKDSSTKSRNRRTIKRDSAIPQPVANRMARRIALTTGLPTICGMSVFIISYLLITRDIIDIPPAATLLISALFFLLGLVGLSYGILSASWEDSPGTFLGTENIKPNIGRVRAAFAALNKQDN